MSKSLTSRTTLDNLKKEAKRWLKALRSGDVDARVRLLRAYAAAPAEPGLRDVQHALAHEYGLASWAALKTALAEGSGASKSSPAPDHAQRVAWFLEQACAVLVNGPAARTRRMNAAARLLKYHPEIAHDSIYTAVVAGDLAEVQNILAERPAAAREKTLAVVSDQAEFGAKEWEPLMFLCYARLPALEASDNAVPIARLLLEHGADPNAHHYTGSPPHRYTALCGVVGEGEEATPRHPEARALVELLLEYGAEPYDVQLFYNTHFRGDILWLLELVYDYSLKAGRRADWDDPAWPMINLGNYGKGARYLLTVAINANNVALAEWLLGHGADPNARPVPHPRVSQRSLHEEALARGRIAIADLLVRSGARPSAPIPPDGLSAFTASCFRLDRAELQRMLAVHPEYLYAPGPIHAATAADRVDIVEMLLELGVSPEIEDPKEGNQRPLHTAGYCGAVRVAKLLIERGAEIDPIETNWNNTPLDAAIYSEQAGMIELLGRYSSQIWNLTFIGQVNRLRELFGEKPELARTVGTGSTPLMWLPDDESLALAIVELYAAHGADPSVISKKGKTAADYAAQRGLEAAAARLRRLADASGRGA